MQQGDRQIHARLLHSCRRFWQDPPRHINGHSETELNSKRLRMDMVILQLWMNLGHHSCTQSLSQQHRHHHNEFDSYKDT